MAYLGISLQQRILCAQDVFDPELQRVIPYLICISLIGIFILLQLRKRFIVDYALPYPSGTASGVLINSLHSIGNKTAARQVLPTPPPSLRKTTSCTAIVNRTTAHLAFLQD